jgi:hypothetical protein
LIYPASSAYNSVDFKGRCGMRKQGWPFPNNPSILNLPNSGVKQSPPADLKVIDLAQRFRDSILIRSDAIPGLSLLGEFVSVGDALRIVITGPGRVDLGGVGPKNIREKFTWAIVLFARHDAVKVFRQDGSEDVFLKKNRSVQVGTFPYSIGDPVWYDMHGQDVKTGTLTNFTFRPGTETIETFEIREDTGLTVIKDHRSVLIRMPLPGPKQDVAALHNVSPI